MSTRQGVVNMKNEQGFTLIEVLIALIIVAVGVLGHAKMQAKSMNIAQQSFFAQTANIALLDLSQRIRGNAEIASNFEYSNLDDGNDVVSNKNCLTSTCTESEFAMAELAEWFDHVKNSLPSPRFSVVATPEVSSLGVVSNAVIYDIQIIWDAAKTGNGSATCDVQQVNSYQCGSMSVWVP